MPANSPNETHGPELLFAQNLHAEKYRRQEESFREMANRISSALADNPNHYHEFRQSLLDQSFLPAGRVQQAMGSPRHVTGLNCFVSQTIDDSLDGIMDTARNAARTMKMGGGIGYDFSTLRPRHSWISTQEAPASGAVSFMDIFDATCGTIQSAGNRRGAQMGVLRVDHPDIEEFVFAKKNTHRLTNFNISVAVTDAFMQAVDTGADFPLQWGGVVYRWVNARELWEEIMRSTWDWAEPGVIFIDAMNRKNNLWYCETIAATNPCFTGDTKVWTSEGHKTFVELAASGKDVEVLTQLADGSLGYRTMRSPRKTRKAANLVKVRFDNRGEVRCTPTHRFFLKDGSEKQAQDLRPGDRIESVYASPAYKEGYKCLTNGADAILERRKGGREDGTLGLQQGQAATLCYDAIAGEADSLGGQQPMNHKVISVEENGVEDVYCGTVDETNRFFVALGDDDGVLVRNCSEQPLPPHGACLLGSFNLVKFLRKDGARYTFDWDAFRRAIPIVVRAMDNVNDASRFPLSEQKQEAMNKRRMGLGVTGLSNAIEAIIGPSYGSDAFVAMEEDILWALAVECYSASADLAEEKGAFPLFEADPYLRADLPSRLPEEVKDKIRNKGIRNSCLTSIAPTGTISLCADNVSSGIEPVFGYHMERRVRKFDGEVIEDVQDYGFRKLGVKGKTAPEVTVDEHVKVLEAAYKYVDSAVSKTCNVDPNMPWAEFKDVYWKAYNTGCKGITTFNIGGKRFGILTSKDSPGDGAGDTEAEDTEDEGTACYMDPATGIKSCE